MEYNLESMAYDVDEFISSKLTKHKIDPLILSSVILAIPMSNDSLLEQIVGRIQRQHPDKKSPPEVLDIHFSGWADKKQNNDRLAVYLRKGWEVVTI